MWYRNFFNVIYLGGALATAGLGAYASIQVSVFPISVAAVVVLLVEEGDLRSLGTVSGAARSCFILFVLVVQLLYSAAP